MYIETKLQITPTQYPNSFGMRRGHDICGLKNNAMATFTGMIFPLALLLDGVLFGVAITSMPMMMSLSIPNTRKTATIELVMVTMRTTT